MKVFKHIWKIGIKILVIQILSIFWVNLGFCEGNEEDGQVTELLYEVTEVVNALPDYQYLQWNNDPNIFKNSLQESYKVLSKEYPSIIGNCLDLYRVQILNGMNKKDEAIKLDRAQIDKSLDKPRLLSILASLNKENEKERNEMRSELGRILPLSARGYRRDQELSPPSPNIIFLSPPRIPIVHSTKNGIQYILARIGDYYESLGFTDDALNLYIESFYSSTPIFWYRTSIRGELWLKIAEIEKNRGNKQLAVKAFFNAAFYWHEYSEQAKNGIIEVLSESEPDKEIISEELILPKDIAIQIANLYKRINLHPLALAVLERSEKDTGESLSSEKEEILEEWNKILEQIQRYYKLSDTNQTNEIDFYVLGQKVSEVEDWAKIQILRPTDTFWKIQE